MQKFECKCVSPYKGEICDQLQHPCADVVCQNGGVCLEQKVSGLLNLISSGIIYNYGLNNWNIYLKPCDSFHILIAWVALKTIEASITLWFNIFFIIINKCQSVENKTKLIKKNVTKSIFLFMFVCLLIKK